MAVEAISTPDVVDSAHVPALGKTAVEVCDLVKTFDNGAVRALDGVSFAVPEGQLLVIIGLSGSGKSTLLRHLNGLHLPSEGSVTVLEQNVPNLNRTDLRNLRKEVGFVFQQFNIVGRLTCIENVLTGTLGRLKGPRIGASMYPKKLRKEAIEQLESWANKIDVQITKAAQGSDPASVAYKAIEEAVNSNFDQVLIDTAGRLQNKKNLMEEYKKIINVLKKIDNDYPNETILVLDGTNGSNMIKQVEIFGNKLNVSSIIITKLDGTAKGGALISIANKYEIPISYVGLGEKPEDLSVFSAKNFARSILNLEE